MSYFDDPTLYRHDMLCVLPVAMAGEDISTFEKLIENMMFVGLTQGMLDDPDQFMATIKNFCEHGILVFGEGVPFSELYENPARFPIDQKWKIETLKKVMSATMQERLKPDVSQSFNFRQALQNAAFSAPATPQ